MNRMRLRSAMIARTRVYERIRAMNVALHRNVDHFPRRAPKPHQHRLTPGMLRRMQIFEEIKASHVKYVNERAGLPPLKVVGPDVCVDTLPIPKTYEEAVTCAYRKYWIKAIAEELQNLINYKV